MDVLTTKVGNDIQTSVYSNNTEAGLCTNFDNFTHVSYKTGLAKTLFY